jgi:hypothetical protein
MLTRWIRTPTVLGDLVVAVLTTMPRAAPLP